LNDDRNEITLKTLCKTFMQYETTFSDPVVNVDVIQVDNVATTDGGIAVGDPVVIEGFLVAEQIP